MSLLDRLAPQRPRSSADLPFDPEPIPASRVRAALPARDDSSFEARVPARAAPSAQDFFEAAPAPTAPPDLVPFGNALAAANAAGLRRLVYSSGARKVIAEANRALKEPADPIRGMFSPPPFYKPGQDGVVDKDRDTHQANQLARFTRQMNSLTQAYALTGDARYADKAVSIADAWARTTKPGFGSAQAGISSYHPLASVFASMEGLKHSARWPPEQKQRFMDWAHAYAEKAEFKGDKYNNRHDWRILFQATAAKLTGDKKMFQNKVAEWRDAVAHTVQPDGLMPEELKRTRSLHYHLYALKPLVALAELARGQGLDLYRTPEGRLLQKGLETVGAGLATPSSWKHQDIHGERASSGAVLFQVAAQRFPHSAALQQISSELWRQTKRNPEWLSALVHGQLSDGSQESGGFPLPNLALYT